MTIPEAFGLLALLGYFVAVAFVLRRGGKLQRVQGCHVLCPFLHESVDCRVIRDVRTGRWVRVLRCTAFSVPEQPVCEQECVTGLNLSPL